jgi:hypothetical protein
VGGAPKWWHTAVGHPPFLVESMCQAAPRPGIWPNQADGGLDALLAVAAEPV